VAGSLGITEGTSKWHINEGRKLLKKKLEKKTNGVIAEMETEDTVY
jgi:DNA-directed RNA polymerase specialized sigma24 family protein